MSCNPPRKDAMELHDVIKLLRNVGERAYLEGNVSFFEDDQRGRYEFHGADRESVRVRIQVLDGSPILWTIMTFSSAVLPVVHSGDFSEPIGVKDFRTKLKRAVDSVTSRPASRVIDPKGQWALKIFGVVLLLFTFGAVKAFAILKPELSFVWFRKEFSDSFGDWQKVISSIGPGGLGEVFFGSLVYSPAAGLSCLGIASFAIFFWTTPVTQSASDLLSLWGVLTGFIIPLVCVGVAVFFVPWRESVIIVVGFITIGSSFFMPTSWISRVPRWSAAARKYRLGKEEDRGGHLSWSIGTGAWDPLDLTTEEIANLVLLHAERCERHVANDKNFDESAVRISLMIVELGGELLQVLEENSGLPQSEVWKKIGFRIRRRGFIAGTRVFLIGKGLLLLGVVCTLWLVTDPVPWEPMVCASSQSVGEGYVIADTPTVFIDDSTRVPVILNSNAEVLEFDSESCG